MSSFKCPRCSFDPGAHAWSALVLAKHKWNKHQIPARGGHNGAMQYFPSQVVYEESKREN